MDGVDTTAAMERLIAFVNTRDMEGGVDRLSAPAALKAWLVEQHLLDGAATVRRSDVEAAVSLREGVRAALLAHEHDTQPAAPAVGAPTGTAVAVPLQLVIGASGDVALAPADVGVAGALAALVAAIPAAVADGTWQRAKACPRTTCQWAFLDQSRNRSRRWCSMEVCGNREKTRSFRERRRGDD